MDIAELFQRQAHARPSGDAFCCGDTRLSWSEVGARTDALAHHLAQRLEIGDRAGIVAHNCHRYWEFHAACAKVGVVAVPVNHFLTWGEMHRILTDVGARALVVDERVDAVAGLLSHMGDQIPEDRVLSFRGRVGAAWDDVATCASPRPPRRHHDVNAIGFTSGTTGRARGAVLLSHTATASALWFATLFGLRADSTFLACMPAYVYRGQAGGMAPVVVGARIVPVPFDAERVLAAIAEYRVTHTILAPAMVDRLLASPAIETHDLSSLEGIWIGGAPTSARSVRELAALVDADLGSVYGMTEATGVSSGRWRLDLPEDELERELASAGHPGPLLDVRLVSPGGDDVGVGEVGEVTVRGDSLFQGYWGERPDDALQDGWYATGDMARLDDDGRLFLVDRRADIIISGGLNVYAAEVERALGIHPSVAACAVVGVPDPTWGETVCAVVVPRTDEPPTLDDLRDHCDGILARYKLPRRVVIRDELPRNAMGKIDKQGLRDQVMTSPTDTSARDDA